MKFLPVALTALAVLCLCGSAAAQTVEASPLFSVGFNASHLTLSNVSYTDSTGTCLRGYLAYDSVTVRGRRPGVLIIPDFDGIGPYEQWRAKLFATLGYTAFVADIYSADIPQGPQMPAAERSRLVGVYNRNIPLYNDRMTSGLAQLRSHPTVDSGNLAAAGYCFGGSGTLELSRVWPDSAVNGLRGVLAYHPGSLLPQATSTPTARGNPIRVAVFGGVMDPPVSTNNVAMFEAELNNSSSTYELTLYGKTAHAFTNPGNTGAYASANSFWSPIADVRSWESTRSFLEDIFNLTDASNPYTSGY